MINAEVRIVTPSEVYFRLSEPNEVFSSDNWQKTTAVAEVERLMYFANRKYIVDTLNGWLNQRRHAVLNQHNYISAFQKDLAYMYYVSYQSLIDFIATKEDFFNTITPSQGRCTNHFLNKIDPILKYCAKHKSQK